MKGYHPGDYSYPRNSAERLEICIGAILTQNTAWTNVEKALNNLAAAEALSVEKLSALDDQALKELIRPAGYFNQKAGYVRNFLEFLKSVKRTVPARSALLECKGIGNETADSMRLYAYSQPEFVIDAYTKRIFCHLGLCKPHDTYMTLKRIVEGAVERDVVVYQEYHALLVEHAKNYYSRKPYGVEDPLVGIVKG